MRHLALVLAVVACLTTAARASDAPAAPSEADVWLYRVALTAWLEGRGPLPAMPPFGRRGAFDARGSAKLLEIVSKLDHKLTANTMNEVVALVGSAPDEMRGWPVLGRMLEQGHRPELAQKAYGHFVDLLVHNVITPVHVTDPQVSLEIEVGSWADVEKEVLVWAETESMDRASKDVFLRAIDEMERHPHTYQDVVDLIARCTVETGISVRIIQHFREAVRSQGRFMSSLIESQRTGTGSRVLASAVADFFLEIGDLSSARALMMSVMEQTDWRFVAQPYLTAVVPSQALEFRGGDVRLFRMEVERLLEVGDEAGARKLHATERARYPADAAALAALDQTLAGKAPATRVQRALAVARAGRLAESLSLLAEARAAKEPLTAEEELELLARPVWSADSGARDAGVPLEELLRSPGPAGVPEQRYWLALAHGQRADAERECAPELVRAPLAPVWVLARTWQLWHAGDRAALDAWLTQARAGLRFTGGHGWVLAELARIAALRGGAPARYDGKH